MTLDTLKDIEKLEADLWEAADNLRANSKLTSSDYFMPVLGVIFLLRFPGLGDVPVYGSTGINGSYNKARVQGPGITTGRSGTLGEFTTRRVTFGH